jgi:hypothetical protein
MWLRDAREGLNYFRKRADKVNNQQRLSHLKLRYLQFAALIWLIVIGCKKSNVPDLAEPRIVQVDPNAQAVPTGTYSVPPVGSTTPLPGVTPGTSPTVQPTTSYTPMPTTTPTKLDMTPNSCMIWVIGPSCAVGHPVNAEFHDPNESTTGRDEMTCARRSVDFFNLCGGGANGIQGVRARYTNSNMAGIYPKEFDPGRFK